LLIQQIFTSSQSQRGAQIGGLLRESGTGKQKRLRQIGGAISYKDELTTFLKIVKGKIDPLAMSLGYWVEGADSFLSANAG